MDAPKKLRLRPKDDDVAVLVESVGVGRALADTAVQVAALEGHALDLRCVVDAVLVDGDAVS